MFEFTGDWEPIVNIVFLVVTGAIAVQAIGFRDEKGESDFVRLLFGAIAAVFFFMVLFQDVLGLIEFGGG
jgi:hypothetical protein